MTTPDTIPNETVAAARGAGAGEQLREDLTKLGVREGSAAAVSGAYEAAFKVVGGEAYEPDLEAYRPDPKNDRRRAFLEAVRSNNPPRMSIQVEARDGRSELVALRGMETRAFHEADVATRREFLNDRIRENRWQIARSGARKLTEACSRLREGDAPPALDKLLAPLEEAYLRGFGLLASVEEMVPLREGGYDRQTTEAWSGELLERAVLCENTEDLRKAHAQPLREDGLFGGITGGWFPAASGFGGGSSTAPYLDDEFLPSWGYGTAQQTFISDIWDELAKAEFAYRRDPLAKKAVHTIRDFTLGRGVKARCKDPKLQEFVDEFWARNRMQQRMKDFAVSSSKGGEIFVRMFPLGDGRSSVRRLRPDCVWEIITDAEDFETPYYYVEMYMTRIQVYIDNAPENAEPHYVRREIEAQYIIHRKLNTEETEVRGRSDLYAGLGYFKMTRDFVVTTVQKEQALSAYVWDYEVDGGPQDVQRVIASLPKGKVDPGSSHVHNKKVVPSAIASGTRAAQGQSSAYETLLNHCAISVEVPREYFGSGARNTRANTFVAEAPTQKRFEERQDWLNDVTREVIDWAIAEGKRCGRLDAVKDFSYRLVWPSILRADAEQRQKLIMNARAAGHLSHKTAAELDYAELELEEIDADSELKLMKEEAKDPFLSVLPKVNEQVFTAPFIRATAASGADPESGAVGPPLSPRKDGPGAVDVGVAPPAGKSGSSADADQTDEDPSGGGAGSQAQARDEGGSAA